MSQSVHLASLVQKEFRHTCKRADRGVHQAGFSCIESKCHAQHPGRTRFHIHPEEERYLNSAAGTTTLATEYSVLSCLINVNMKYG